MTRAYTAALVAELEVHGVTNYEIERGGHNKLRFVYAGQKVLFVFPSTPSDIRGVRNSLSDLRRAMGVKREIIKSARPKKHRNRTETAPECPAITIRPNPFDELPRLLDPLRPHREAIEDRTLLALYRLSFFKGSFREWKRRYSIGS